MLTNAKLKEIYAALHTHPGKLASLYQIVRCTDLPPPVVAEGLRLLAERGLIEVANLEELRYRTAEE